MLDEILVKGVGEGDEEDVRFVAAPAHAAHALVHGNEGAWIAHEDAGVQTAYVDAHLHGRGAHHALEAPLEEALLNAPALGGKEPGPVRGDRVPVSGIALDEPRVDQLRGAPRLGECEGARVFMKEPVHEVAGEGVGAPRGVHEEEAPARPGRAALGDGGGLPPSEDFKKAFAVGQGR